MRKTLAVIPLNAEIGTTVNPVIHPSSQELVEIISNCHKNNLATILLLLKHTFNQWLNLCGNHKLDWPPLDLPLQLNNDGPWPASPLKSMRCTESLLAAQGNRFTSIALHYIALHCNYIVVKLLKCLNEDDNGDDDAGSNCCEQPVQVWQKLRGRAAARCCWPT